MHGRVRPALAAAHQAAGDLTGAIEAAGRRLDLDPLDEAGHVRLMDLYAAMGDRAAAMPSNTGASVATLERELGVAPLVTTTARYEAIRDAPIRDAPVASTLESADSQRGQAGVGLVEVERSRLLVGRDGELPRQAADALQAGAANDGSVVAVIGEAGIGKTAFGEAIAAEVRAGGGLVIGASAYPGERTIPYATLVEALRGIQARPDGAGRLGFRSTPRRAPSLPACCRRSLRDIGPPRRVAMRPAPGSSPRSPTG